MVCTGNVCRSPMAAALMRRRLELAGVSVPVLSAGLLAGTVGSPASPGAVKALARWDLDITDHRSQLLTTEMIGDAELVIGMAREHLREAVVLVPPAWERVFTLKELVRRGSAAGPRGAHERLGDWLERLGEDREPAALMGSSPMDDVADPIGMSDATYRATAGELDDLINQVVELVWGLRTESPVSARAAEAASAPPISDALIHAGKEPL